jgi:hypothetical protein
MARCNKIIDNEVIVNKALSVDDSMNIKLSLTDRSQVYLSAPNTTNIRRAWVYECPISAMRKNCN